MRSDLLSERAERRAGELLAEVKKNKSRYHWWRPSL
jgi:hypothetical protein